MFWQIINHGPVAMVGDRSVWSVLLRAYAWLICYVRDFLISYRVYREYIITTHWAGSSFFFVCACHKASARFYSPSFHRAHSLQSCTYNATRIWMPFELKALPSFSRPSSVKWRQYIKTHNQDKSLWTITTTMNHRIIFACVFCGTLSDRQLLINFYVAWFFGWLIARSVRRWF